LASAAVNQDMALRDLLILSGLIVAGWGHLLLGERRLASAVWRKLDDLFPPALRSTDAVAGAGLLVMGGFCVLGAMAAGA
jgi:hypothetical protein